MYREPFEVAKTSREVREQLHYQGYANLEFELGKAACNELFSDFKNFVQLCNEPGGEALQEAVAYQVSDLGNGAYFLTMRQPGIHNPYEDRTDAGKDHKYVMHFGALTTKIAREKLGELPKEMGDFLDKCDEFYFSGRKVGSTGAKSLGIENAMFPANLERDVHLLRIIDYIASDNGHLGEAHFDRAVTTLAISESGPGLRGAPGDNGYLRPVPESEIQNLKSAMQPIQHHEHVAKFFASAGLRRLPDEVRAEQGLDTVPLLVHDIVNENPGENRQAAVMFFNPHLDFEGYSVPGSEETSINLDAS